MKINVLGVTCPLYHFDGNQDSIEITKKYEEVLESLICAAQGDSTKFKNIFDEFSGKLAGICYMKNNWEGLVDEPIVDSLKRANGTKASGHHSVFDHDLINLYLEDVPKALAMVLNNESMYTTSEKSARYTKMVLKEDEQKLYDKWLVKFEKLITDKYLEKYPDFFAGSKIPKLAQENARYLISVFTPTSMGYSVSYRQLNYLYTFMQKEIARNDQNTFYSLLKPAMIDFCEAIEKTGFIDVKFEQDKKNRSLALYSDYKPREYFGDVYATSYKGSFAQLAQAQRHRTLDYTMSLLDKNEFYVPPILKSFPELVEEWKADCNAVAHVFPQGMLVNINEMGTYKNFILKMKERKCSFAQLEINQQTDALLKKYVAELKASGHSLAEELETYTRGSRCTFADYQCNGACKGFTEGILGTREI